MAGQHHNALKSDFFELFAVVPVTKSALKQAQGN
jgi:hypothetical protein